MPRHQRDPKLEQFWRRHLGRQAGSGLTVRDYCCQHGLRESSFYSWRRVIGERDRRVEPVAPATPAFLPIAVVDCSGRFMRPCWRTRSGPKSSRSTRPACPFKKKAATKPSRAGSDEGGRTAAVLYSFTQTCRRHGIDPFAYLQDVLTRLPQGDYAKLSDLFPQTWALAQRAQASH